MSRWLAWHQTGLPEYSPIGKWLPVVENSVAQITPGESTYSATLLSNGAETVGQAFLSSRSIARTVLKQGTIAFYVPLRWKGDLKFNGVLVSPHSIHAPVDDVHYHICGQEREIAGCIFPRARFIETVAALRGVAPDEVALPSRALELTPAGIARLRTQMTAIVAQARRAGAGAASNEIPFDPAECLYEMVLDAYLEVRAESELKSSCIRNSHRLVQAAEERYAQDPQGTSLADLCVASGVSKSTLYDAFWNWCGMPPIAYFHKRRLARARARLFEMHFRRGAVKQVASEVGITELGRFARDYRRIYGESPSTTLSQTLP